MVTKQQIRGKGNTKRQLITIGVLLLLISLGFSGCTQQEPLPKTIKEKFIGTWKNTTAYFTMELCSNGNCTFWSYPGTWNLTDGKLVINTISVGVPATYTYVYLFFYENTTLKLIPTINTKGNGYVLQRQ
jgi:hypothetical protein